MGKKSKRKNRASRGGTANSGGAAGNTHTANSNTDNTENDNVADNNDFQLPFEADVLAETTSILAEANNEGFEALSIKEQADMTIFVTFLQNIDTGSLLRPPSAENPPITSLQNHVTGSYLTFEQMSLVQRYMTECVYFNQCAAGEVTQAQFANFMLDLQMCQDFVECGDTVDVHECKRLSLTHPCFTLEDGGRLTVQKWTYLAFTDPNLLRGLVGKYNTFQANVRLVEVAPSGQLWSPAILIKGDDEWGDGWEEDIAAVRSFKARWPRAFDAMANNRPLGRPIHVIDERGIGFEEATRMLKEAVLFVVAEEARWEAWAAVNMPNDSVATSAESENDAGGATAQEEDRKPKAVSESVSDHGQRNAAVINCQICSGHCSRMVTLYCGCFFCRQCIMDHGKINKHCPVCSSKLCLDIHFPNLSHKYFKKQDICFWCTKVGPKGSMKLCRGCKEARDETTYCNLDCHGAAWLTDKKTAHAHCEA